MLSGIGWQKLPGVTNKSLVDLVISGHLPEVAASELFLDS